MSNNYYQPNSGGSQDQYGGGGYGNMNMHQGSQGGGGYGNMNMHQGSQGFNDRGFNDRGGQYGMGGGDQMQGGQRGGNNAPPQQGGGMQQGFGGQPDFVNAAVQEAAFQYGSTFAAAGKDYVDKNLGKYITLQTFNFYFCVSNSYVLNKIKLLLFPFRHKSWARRQYNNRMSNQTEYLPPRDDVNAPDLYIPSMAFVTYILLCGLALGTQGKFKPDALGVTASAAFGWLFIEVGMIYLGFYLLNVSGDVHILDVFAYCGYKYVGCVLTVICTIVSGSNIFAATALSLYLGFSVAFVVVKTLRLVILPESSSSNFLSSHNKRRNYFLLLIAALQVIATYSATRVEFKSLGHLDGHHAL
eukprot:Nk52_evm21s265 gene=Nk52_evmTU21s265